jgi:hypothetical protein
MSIICLDGLGRTKDRSYGITSPRRDVTLSIRSQLISVQVVPACNLDRPTLLSYSRLSSVTRCKYGIVGQLSITYSVKQQPNRLTYWVGGGSKYSYKHSVTCQMWSLVYAFLFTELRWQYLHWCTLGRNIYCMILTFFNPVAVICTTWCNVKKLCNLPPSLFTGFISLSRQTFVIPFNNICLLYYNEHGLFSVK